MREKVYDIMERARGVGMDSVYVAAVVLLDKHSKKGWNARTSDLALAACLDRAVTRS